MRGTVALLAATALIAAAAPASAAARTHATGHSERLAARARRGDRVARTTLVEEHMGIVRSVAFRYRELGLPVEDLVQEGAIGLLAAVDDYDSSLGTSFSTHAFWRVRAAVTHAVTARGNLVRVPRPVLERRRQVAAARHTLSAAGREPTVRDLAAATALAPEQVAEALAPPNVVSLDALLPDGTLLADRIADDPARHPDALTVTATERRALRAALRRLRPRKQAILMRHFGIDREPETLTAIAADLRLSPERTRALKDEALGELASDFAGVT
jgi:RNA polymerase sigma factor (sigma-70 family)